jgi:hypothetical protein
MVSDQTIPNILGIYHFKPDELLFVNTDDMQKKHKTDHIINALERIGLNYRKQFQYIVVKEDSVLDCKRQLDQWIVGKESSLFTVNLTGGTKIMSIAAYEYFKEYSAKMIYIPIGKNEFITPFPKSAANAITPLSLRLNVTAYLSAYGLKVINAEKLPLNHADAQQRQELSGWIVRNYNEVKPLLERFSEKLRKFRNESRGHEWSTTYEPKYTQEKELFQKLGFAHQDNIYSKHLTKSEIIYLTGGWLEEYCYNELFKLKDNGIDDIVTGIKPQANGRENEFDVMFTKDNALYTVECKSLDQNDDTKTEALYKIAALQKDFGLRVESFFVSTSPHILIDGHLKSAVKARAEQFKTTVVTPNEVVDFAKKIAEKLKMKDK